MGGDRAIFKALRRRCRHPILRRLRRGSVCRMRGEARAGVYLQSSVRARLRRVCSARGIRSRPCHFVLWVQTFVVSRRSTGARRSFELPRGRLTILYGQRRSGVWICVMAMVGQAVRRTARLEGRDRFASILITRPQSLRRRKGSDAVRERFATAFKRG